MKRRIYFVRHGESESNEKKIHSAPTSPLSAKGFEQGEFIAERCSTLSAHVLITSTMMRAAQTAELISKKTGLTPEYSDLFVEGRGIGKFIDVPHADKEALDAYKQLSRNYGTPGWRYDDEENYEDHCARAGEALKFLEQRNESHILVVTHGLFLRILLAHVIFDKPTPVEIQKITHRSDMANTGLTIFDFDDEQPLNAWGEKSSPWRFWVWNDHAHLG